MKAIAMFFRRLFCRHSGGEMVDAFRAADYDHTRTVYGVFVCPKCGARYTKEVNRTDEVVKNLLAKSA